MYAQRLSVFLMTLAGLCGVAQAQGPWPTMNQPTFFSPVQEFFTPRSYTTNYSSPNYGQYQGTPIIPGVPQCANGQCRQSCPNGQCSTSNRCANGQCATPRQSFYQPGGFSDGNSPTGNCTNGVCRSNNNCPNGQCGNRNRGFNTYGNNGNSFQWQPNSTFGLRPLTPVNPNDYQSPRGGQVNRLVPLDGGFPVNERLNVPQGPMYRDRESMVPQDQDYANDPTVRLQ